MRNDKYFRSINAIDLEEVYLTRASYSMTVMIWDPNVGIVKKKGCVEYHSASRVAKPRSQSATFHGRIGHTFYSDCQELFGFEVEQGCAYLFNFKTMKAKRIDEDMALWSQGVTKVVS